MSIPKVVNLKPPVAHVLLFVRLDSDGWRFHGWKAAVGYTIPEEPPQTTLGRAFPTPEVAAEYFTNVLTHPEEVIPTEPHCVPGHMPPAPDCDYYWPPSLERCIDKYESDLAARPEHQLPIHRVFVLGAGFSHDFQFGTSDKIVKEVMSFFEKWQPSDWYRNQYQRLLWWLDHKFPTWRKKSPPLYKFLDSFFPPDKEFVKKTSSEFIDPIVLFDQGISWESGNFLPLISDRSYIPNEGTYEYLLSFEALLAVYLLIGRMQSEVEMPWAVKLFKNIKATDAILTFNWDVIPEALMVSVDTPFCRYDWTSERTKLIKLHGSVDLLGTPNIIMRCDLEANRERFECVTDLLWRVRTNEDVLVRTKRWPFGRLLEPSERYNKSAVLIMPPHYPLGYGYKLIQFNWRKARTALERAREVYILGYSISEEDKAFHSLVKKVSRGWDSKVTVDVWDKNPLVGVRAKKLFGSQHVTFHEGRVSSFHFR